MSTVIEVLRKGNDNEIASVLCGAVLTSVGCNSCPVSNKCRKDCNGMKEFLKDETEKYYLPGIAYISLQQRNPDNGN